MGRDKLPLKIGDITLLDRVHGALSSRCEEIFIVGEGGHTPAGVRRIADLRRSGEGPLAGIEAGLLAARHRAVFVAAGDMPFLTEALVEYLLGLLSGYVLAVVPSLEGELHPLCAVYGRELNAEVSTALDRGVRSVRELLGGLPGIRYVREGELQRFGDPNLLLANVNSCEDLARARAVLREGTPHG
jgi:molybdopterin-guanine dinucleotide biosynthesis protein A